MSSCLGPATLRQVKSTLGFDTGSQFPVKMRAIHDSPAFGYAQVVVEMSPCVLNHSTVSRIVQSQTKGLLDKVISVMLLATGATILESNVVSLL